MRFPGWQALDRGFGQLGQPDRQVDLRPWRVDLPATAVAARVAAKGDAAELKTAVEIVVDGDARIHQAALPELRLDADGDGDRHKGEQNARNPPPSHQPAHGNQSTTC